MKVMLDRPPIAPSWLNAPKFVKRIRPGCDPAENVDFFVSTKETLLAVSDWPKGGLP